MSVLTLLPPCDMNDPDLAFRVFPGGESDEQLGCVWDSPTAGELVLDWVLGDWVKDTRNGLGQMIKDTTTSWIRVPSPSVVDDAGNQTEAITFIQQSTAWYTSVFLMVSIVLAGIFIIWSRRAEAAQNLAKLMITFTVISSGAAVVAGTLLLVTDAFSTWIIDQSLEGTAFADNLYGFFNNDAVVVSSVAMLGLMGLGLITCGIQYLIMLGRGAALFVLIGTLPFAAAFYLTEQGQQLVKKQISWILAFILYKPAAAIVYATGFRLMGASEGSGTSSAQDLALRGIVLLCLAIFTLPAIMRLVTPAVNELTGGRGAGSSAVGAATTVAASGMAAGKALSRAAR